MTTFEHEFWIEHAKASKVCVAGEFNRWTPALSLTRAEGKTWRAKATLPLAGNRTGFAYKFVVDDTEWVCNPSLPLAKDAHGHQNNLLSVPVTGGMSLAISGAASGPNE